MRLVGNLSFRAIIFAGILVGSLDILAALITFTIRFHSSPLVVLNYIASGAFGKKAITGGTLMTVAGLLFHYFFSLLFTFFFFMIYAHSKILSKSRWLTGLAYGIFIWLTMNEIVVPLSKAPFLQQSFSRPMLVAEGILTLIICIGLPLSFIAHCVLKPATGRAPASS